MNVHFTARHLSVPPDIKAYAEKRLTGLGKILFPADVVDVILSAERGRQRAELLVKGKRTNIRVAQDGRDLAVVLNDAFDVLELKLRKEREKFRDKKRRNTRGTSAVSAEGEAELLPRIVRTAYYAAKPLSVAEAIVEFELRRKEVLMFRPDPDEDRWAVLFRRKDGRYGLVQPE